jgi:hypothetical protein
MQLEKSFPKPLVAVVMGLRKPLETFWSNQQTIVNLNGFRKPFHMGTWGSKKLFYDRTSRFLNPLNQ